MNNKEFVEKLLKIEQSPTRYAKGCFGQTKSILAQKKKQYPSWYTDARMNDLNKSDNATRFYDCIGLIKSVLWMNKSGQVIYTSNGVPDYDETTFFNKCTNRSSDFEHIEVGEMVWMPGHVGVYIGNGCVVECTNAFTKDVCITTFIKGNNKYPYRVWQKHGKIPYIEYVKNVLFQVQTEHPFVECHKEYNSTKHYSKGIFLDIVETKDNFGKTSNGEWVDLTKCKRVVN